MGEVPDRPALRPDVQLIGRTQGSGFAAEPWLVQRGDRYLHVTELIYRILEQADGWRTLDQIAAALSETTSRRVRADQVAHLVGSLLIPAGLVVGADGSVEASARSTRPSRVGSPLAVSLRMAIVGPRIVDPIARVLQLLYAPPIFAAVLALAVLGHGWLYLMHGIGGGVHETLYRPGLILLLLAFLVPSAAFHELGHAAALRYGGGRSRGIGVGLYLVYPVFYTDVTDNYRLGRLARVRTDLGGFYFNLIFVLGLFALYLITGQEFLLLVIVLIDLEILYQLLPFVRLDGYWVLADLTGIPDFFSLMGAFLRSVLPVPGWKGPRLARLKWWASAVFGLYVLAVVPVLALLAFLALTSFPRTAARAWDSLRLQVGAFSQAQAAGDAVAAAESVVHMVSLALPVLGLSLVIFGVGRRLLGALWCWSRPMLSRRLVGAQAGIGAVALAGFLWATAGGQWGARSIEASYGPIGPGDGDPAARALADPGPSRVTGDSGAADSPAIPTERADTPGSVALMPEAPPSDEMVDGPTPARAAGRPWGLGQPRRWPPSGE